MLTLASHASPSTDLTALLGAVHSLRADFTQTIFDNRGKAIQKSYGHMALQRPGRFRWEIVKPIPQLIIANPTKLWIFDKDLDQVTIRSLKHAAGETPALLLSHENAIIDNDFSVQDVKKSSAEGRWFLLKPKQADSMFDSIQMGFLHNQIQEMQLKDHLGHTTRIQFTHIEANQTLSPALFIFKPPANVDVINETRSR